MTLLDTVATAGLTVWAGSALVSGKDAGAHRCATRTAQRHGGPVEITLMREDGSPISPTDFLVLTEEAEGHTSFDVYLSSQPAVSFAASIPPASVAGRIFRELSFLPR